MQSSQWPAFEDSSISTTGSFPVATHGTSTFDMAAKHARIASRPNHSIERTSKSLLRKLSAAAHVEC